MHSTMQAAPLSVASILAHASGVHGAKQVISATEQGLRAASYRQIGQRSAQLALALRRLGVTGDDRVATFQWNNQEHPGAIRNNQGATRK